MKTKLECIKCGHKQLWIIDRVLQPTETSSLQPLHVTSWKLGWDDAAKGLGHFQAFICAQCGYTEWYAQALEGLKGLVVSPDTGVRLVSSEPGSAGPFR